MCGRYYIEPDSRDETLLALLDELARERGNCEAHAAMRLGEIFPAQIAPALTSDGPRMMKWGYTGSKNRVINARSETALEKPMFRNSMLFRRCLLPASGYYEWQRTPGGSKTKQKFALFTSAPLLFMAGLWRQEQSEDLPVFVILTRCAAPGLAWLHDRMPVILPPQAQRAWLNKTADPAAAMALAIEEMDFAPAG